MAFSDLGTLSVFSQLSVLLNLATLTFEEKPSFYILNRTALDAY